MSSPFVIVLYFHRVRSGYGEHRRDLRSAGVWLTGGHLHGSAGVRVDVEADARN